LTGALVQSWFLLVLSTVLTSGLGLQVQPDVSADKTFYAVSYVETRADSAKAAADALRRYRDASRTLAGFVRIELFEQIGRPGHFTIVETWRDQQAFDTRDAAIQKQLLGALQSIRISDYDQRPYKTLTTGKGSASPDAQAVYVISHVDIAPNSQGPPPGPLLTTLAETSRKEPGNLKFDVLQHTMRGNHYTVVEGWRNQQALDAHVAAAHTRQYRDALQPMTGSPLDERAYKAID
jgi:quinol monooxygenase YgiN